MSIMFNLKTSSCSDAFYFFNEQNISKNLTSLKNWKQWLSNYLPIDRMKNDLFHSNKGFFLIKGLPVDKAFSIPSPVKISPKILETTMNLIGQKPFGYYEEKNGAIIHDVFPIPGKEKTNSNASRVEFGFHCDNPFLEKQARPETIGLFCLNNEASANTKIIHLSTILKNLTTNDIKVLTEKRFRFRSSESFELNGVTIISSLSEIIKKTDSYDEIRFAAYNVITEDQKSKAVLKKLVRIINDNCWHICLNPGDLLLFNNHQCLHGRDTIHGKRWLQRIYGTSLQNSLLDNTHHMSIWDIYKRGDHVIT